MKRKETIIERIERALDIDIYRQAKRPRAEVQKELRDYGIDTAAMAKEAMRITKEAVMLAKTKQQTPVASAISQSNVHATIEGVKDSVIRTGQKIANHIQETANALAAGLTDFLVTSPFGRLQAVPMRGGSGASTTLKLRIATLGVRVTFRLKGARGETVFASVVSLNDGKVSHILDGGTVINGGNVVGRFADGYAEFTASALVGQFGLRDSQGVPQETVVEKES